MSRVLAQGVLKRGSEVLMPSDPLGPNERLEIRRVLCPIDLSDTSKHALTHARAIAGWYDASLTVVEVVWPGLPPLAVPGAFANGLETPILTDEDRAAFLAELEVFSRPSVEEPAVTTEVYLRDGLVVPTILRMATELPADLLVIGTHGRSGFDRLVLGSVAEKVLRKASCPVLTIPPRVSTNSTNVRYQTIVCAVDFSPASVAGLRYALSLAEENSARLVLLHVLDWAPELMARPTPGSEAEVHEHAMRESLVLALREAVPAEARNWCTPEELVVVGRPHEEVVRIASEQRADLIVIGVHGRSMIDLAFFGSTTSQVVRHASCPVLTLRT